MGETSMNGITSRICRAWDSLGEVCPPDECLATTGCMVRTGEAMAKEWDVATKKIDQQKAFGDSTVISDLRKLSDRLLAENARLREALTFYAEGGHYAATTYGRVFLHDHGEHARKALEATNG